MLVVAVLTAIPSGPAPGDAATPLTLEQLMRTLSRVEMTSAKFVERKYLGVLSEPLVHRGTLTYEAPDYLAKTFESGEAESYEIRAEELRIVAANGTYRKVALETQPLVSAFIDAFRATLAGDGARLTASYETSLEGTKESWRLVLSPKLPGLAEHLESVIIEGSGAAVRTVDVREPNGDHSMMMLDAAGE